MKATYEKMYESLDYGPIASARGLVAADHVLILFPPPGKVLCIGAGNAYEAVFLASNGYDVTVIDYVKAPVRNPKFKQIVGDATNLGAFKDDEFKLVVCCECIEHIEETHIDKFLLGIKRVTTFFYLTIDDKDDPPYHSHLCLHEPKWWIAKFEALGFTGQMFNPAKYAHMVGDRVLARGFPSNHGINFFGNKIL